tara:strand:- start:3220 stop:3597 length:378 start_codon:yes stop_codon:yes gene_type:complete
MPASESGVARKRFFAAIVIGFTVMIAFAVRYSREDLTEEEVRAAYDVKRGYVPVASPADADPPIPMGSLAVGACARRCKGNKKCGGFAFHKTERKCFYYHSDDLKKPLGTKRSNSAVIAFVRKAR